MATLPPPPLEVVHGIDCITEATLNGIWPLDDEKPIYSSGKGIALPPTCSDVKPGMCYAPETPITAALPPAPSEGLLPNITASNPTPMAPTSSITSLQSFFQGTAGSTLAPTGSYSMASGSQMGGSLLPDNLNPPLTASFSPAGMMGLLPPTDAPPLPPSVVPLPPSGLLLVAILMGLTLLKRGKHD